MEENDMIFDKLENAALYKGINENIDLVLEKAKEYSAENFPAEPVVLNDSARMNNASYETHPFEGAVTEAHRAYIDVMIMVDGAETIYVKPVSELTNITKEYDPSIEALLASNDDDMTPVTMKPGYFCILFPQDAHSPGCIFKEAQKIKKFIGKVKI